VTAWYEACTFVDCPTTRMVASNPTRSLDICLHLSVFCCSL